ncbi:MAG: extracellular solute-binding protein [Aestuariibacter sp.]
MKLRKLLHGNILLLPWLLAAQTLVLAQETTGEDKNITMALSLGSYDFQSIFDDNRKQLGFDVVQARIDNADMKLEILTRIDTKALPDAIIMPSDTLGLEQARFSTIPRDWIDPHMSDSNLALAEVEGELKGIPLIAGNHLLLYYNKSLIQQPALSWQQLKSQQSTLERAELIGWPYHEGFWILPFLSAFDALPFEEGQIRFQQPGTLQAFQFLKELRDNKVLDTSCNYQCNQDKFINSRLAYIINGVWSHELYAKHLGDNLGIALLPQIGDKKMRPYRSAHVLAFPNQGVTGKKRASLQKLSLLMQSETIQLRLWKDFRALPTNKKVEEQILQNANDKTQVLFKQLEGAPAMPNEEVMAIVWEAIIIGFSRFDGGAMTAEQASNYMQYIAEKSRDEK